MFEEEEYRAYIRDIIKKVIGLLVVIVFVAIFIKAWQAGDESYLEQQKQQEFSVFDLTTDASPEALPTETAVLVFAGEVNLDKRYNALVPEAVKSPAACIEDNLIRIFTEADLFAADNNFAFTAHTGDAFRTEPENAVFWSKVGADLLSVVGKQVRAYGAEGLSDTVDALAAEDIDTVETVYTTELGGKTVTVVAAALTDDTALSDCLVRIRKARADFTVAYVQFGSEGAIAPSAVQIKYAKALVSAGADAVIGTGTHTLQSVEYYNGKPIFYGIGDLWCGSAPGESAAVQLTLSGEDALTVEVLPCINIGSRTYLANGTRREEMLARLALSETAKIYENGIVTPK